MRDLGLIQKLENRYDAENDISPEYPNINWAERDLLTLVEALIDETDRLQNEINSLGAVVDELRQANK